MVRLEEHKAQTEDKLIEKAFLPNRVYIPLSQHSGKICNPEVKIGDIVLVGQKIASVQAQVSAPIHASITGKVVSIQDWPHPVLGRCKSIVMEGDGTEKLYPINPKPQTEIENFTADQIRNIVFEAGIVGMGGASFPTHIKLNPPKPVDTLIINGAECEPYLTCDERVMIEQAKEVVEEFEAFVERLLVRVFVLVVEDEVEIVVMVCGLYRVNEFRGVEV